jgi:hypothetical protein
VAVWGVKRVPHLRLKLNLSTFLPELQRGIAADSSIPDFLTQFNGLYIEPDTNQVASLLPYFVMTPGSDLYSRPGVVVYYSNASSDSNTVSYYFQTGYSASYTYISRNYSGAPAYKYLFGSTDSNVLLVQNRPGASIDFRMPYVKNLPLAVYNKAQLVLTQVDTLRSDVFSAPARIFPVRIQDDGTATSMADRLPISSSEPINFIDGTLRTATIGGIAVSQYVINFPREVQRSVIEQRNQLHLRIGGTATYPGAYRLLAGSRNHPAPWRLKVNIAYSKQ